MNNSKTAGSRWAAQGEDVRVVWLGKHKYRLALFTRERYLSASFVPPRLPDGQRTTLLVVNCQALRR